MSDAESVEYLQHGFDPWSLTVPRLRSILVKHSVHYPATAKKPQLVELFNDQVIPQAKKYLDSRARARRTSKGIVDAGSQDTIRNDELDLMPPPASAPRARSPRKATRAKREMDEPDQDVVLPLARPTPRKRQSRSASTQLVGGTSDTDTGTDADASRSVRRSRRTTPAVKLEAAEEDEFFKRSPAAESVFTHDNPFQSGSSPAPVKTPTSRRKTAAFDPATARTPSTARRRTDGYSSADVSLPGLAGFDGPPPQPLGTPKRRGTPKTPRFEVDRVYDDAGEEFTPDEQLELEQEDAEHPERAILRHPRAQPPARKISLATPAWVLVVTLLSAYAAWYRQEKVAVGYCGLGRPPTPIIPDTVRLPDWATALAEPQCEPCPPHAYCYEDFSARCEPDFILRQHPLSLGGLVPLPPTCEPDGEKARRVRAVADRTVEELRDRRAKYECGESVGAEAGQLLHTPSVEEQELKEAIGQKRSRRMNAEEFDDLWISAIGEVKARDEVEVTTEEPIGDTGSFPTVRLSSTSLARLPFACAARRSFRLALARYRLSIGGVMLAVLSALYARSRYRAHRATSAKIPGLVDLVLERLAAQKELAFEDGADDAFLFLPNLRDDVLRATHSLAERERVWQRVRAVVEQNSNVRTGQREGRNGEVGRAWEWIGPSNSGSAVEGASRRGKGGRVSWGPGARGGEDAGTPRKWEEGRPIY